MRVCGVTFDHTTNYGSCFQALALKTAIERMEIGGEKCSYSLIPVSKFRNLNRLKYYLRRPKDLARRLIKRYMRLFFCSFEKKHMRYAECNSVKDLIHLNETQDAFVCGSDVIWRLEMTYGQRVFFLDFATRYAFSYGASFGVSDPNMRALRNYAPLIERSAYVSPAPER